MGFHILFQIYAYLKNHNIDYFNLFFNNIFLAFQDQIIPQTKQFILLIWINGIEWTFAWMQLLGKIFIYICHFIGIYCIYCHGFYKDIFMGVYHILWLLPFFLSWCFHHCPRESHIYFHITNDSIFLYKT